MHVGVGEGGDSMVRDRSLITGKEGGGGAQHGRGMCVCVGGGGGWQVKFYPYKELGGGGLFFFSHA